MTTITRPETYLPPELMDGLDDPVPGELLERTEEPARKKRLAGRLQGLPLIAEIRKALDGAEGNRVSRKVFLGRLRDHFSPPEARRQLQTALDWARYGEVFDFDPDSEEFVLAPRE